MALRTYMLSPTPIPSPPPFFPKHAQQQEWDNHLSSYDHHHRKRLKELKERESKLLLSRSRNHHSSMRNLDNPTRTCQIFTCSELLASVPALTQLNTNPRLNPDIAPLRLLLSQTRLCDPMQSLTLTYHLALMLTAQTPIARRRNVKRIRTLTASCAWPITHKPRPEGATLPPQHRQSPYPKRRKACQSSCVRWMKVTLALVEATIAQDQGASCPCPLRLRLAPLWRLPMVAASSLLASHTPAPPSRRLIRGHLWGLHHHRHHVPPHSRCPIHLHLRGCLHHPLVEAGHYPRRHPRRQPQLRRQPVVSWRGSACRGAGRDRRQSSAPSRTRKTAHLAAPATPPLQGAGQASSCPSDRASPGEAVRTHAKISSFPVAQHGDYCGRLLQ